MLEDDVADFERSLHEALAIDARRPNEVVEAYARFQLVMTAEWSSDYRAGGRRVRIARWPWRVASSCPR